MSFFGLSPLALTLSLIGAGSLVALLYLLKNEQRRLVVPSLRLWESALGSKASKNLWTRLRRLLSFLLALTVVATLIFAVADPRKERGRGARSVVVLIDASASMQATDERPTRLARAKARLRDELSTLAEGDRALIAQLTSSVTPLSGFSEDHADLARAIAQVEATDLAGNLARGARFAIDATSQSERAELWLFSDGNLEGRTEAGDLLQEHAKLKVRYFKVGKDGRNVAIDHFAVRRYPLDRTRQEGLVGVRNFGTSRESVTLTVKAEGVPLHQESLEIEPGQRISRILPALAAREGSALEARIVLKKPDALAADDQAFAALPSRKRTRVLLVSESNRFLEAALLLDKDLDVQAVTPARYRGAEGFDVVVFDRFVPSEPAAASALYLRPEARASAILPFEVKGEIERPFFERVDQEHPATRHAALRDVNIARALRLVPRKGDRILAQAADHAPLIVSGTRDAQRFVALAFDARESDLPLRAAWPLFLLGALDSLTGEADRSVTSNLVGSPTTLWLEPEQKSVTLHSPDGKKRNLLAVDGKVRLELTQRGVYQLDAGALRTAIAANVPAEQEGTIAPSDRVLAAASPPSARRSTLSWFGQRPWVWLASLAALLFMIEWLTFHRRWTV